MWHTLLGHLAHVPNTHRSLREQWPPSMVTNPPGNGTLNPLVTRSFFKLRIQSKVPAMGRLPLSNPQPLSGLPPPLPPDYVAEFLETLIIMKRTTNSTGIHLN